MVVRLLEDEVGALAGREDVLPQVFGVDLPPDAGGDRAGLVRREVRVAVEVRPRPAKRRALQGQEALEVPALEVVRVGVDVDREVEVVRHEGLRRVGVGARLEHVEALDDDDVRGPERDPLAWHDVVALVRIDRALHADPAGLDVGHEGQQAPRVVALREALAVHETAGLERHVGQQETIGGDEVDARAVGPARQQLAQQAGGGALADRDAAGDADDVGHAHGLGVAEEGGGRPVELLAGGDVEVEQARERQVDLHDLVHRHRLVESADPSEVGLGQRHRGVGAQPTPLLVIEVEEERAAHRAFTARAAGRSSCPSSGTRAPLAGPAPGRPAPTPSRARWR